MAEALTPKDLAREGQNAYRAARYQEAAAAFSSAARGFTAAGQALEAAEASNNASVAHLKAENAAAALQAAEGTDTVFSACGDTRRQGMALANQAAALEDLSRLEDALARYEASAACLKKSADPEMRAAVLKNISSLQIRTGKQLQALASMETALENQKKLSIRERLLKKLLRIPMDMINRR